MDQLKQLFAQGDADLRRTAGEPAVLVRKAGSERVALTAVISPAPVEYQLPGPSGQVITCDRTATISREEAARAPQPGDTLEAGGHVYRIHRVTGWAYDTSWHADLSLKS